MHNLVLTGCLLLIGCGCATRYDVERESVILRSELRGVDSKVAFVGEDLTRLSDRVSELEEAHLRDAALLRRAAAALRGDRAVLDRTADALEGKP